MISCLSRGLANLSMSAISNRDHPACNVIPNEGTFPVEENHVLHLRS
jgi:hypothetical protein